MCPHIQSDSRTDADFSRIKSQFPTSSCLSAASDDQQDPLVKDSSFSWTKAAFQAPLRKSSVQQLLRGKKRKLQGWRFGLAMSASSATIVLLMNVLIVVVAVSTSKLENGIGTLFTGDCKRVSTWNTALHILINALSSILLSASNYAMQVLSSPARSECDAAHARRDWLDIGANGVRNLTRVAWQRRILWTLLGVSSIPIHLLFNSAVFKTLDTNDYSVFVVSRDFLEGQHVSYIEQYPDTYQLGGEDTLEGLRGDYRNWVESAHQQYHENQSLYEKLDPAECILTYESSIVSGHSDVLLVTEGNDTDVNVFEAMDMSHGADGPFSGSKSW